MKKIISVILIAIFLLSLFGCGENEATLLSKDSALEEIIRIANEFETGKIRCYKYSTENIWTMLSSTCEEASFGKSEGGDTLMRYRMRNPFVFLYYPSYDFYDGESYHYKYDGAWMSDVHSRFSSRINVENYGLDSTMLRSLKIKENEIYETVGGLCLHVLGIYRGESVIEIDMKTNKDFKPTSMVIRTVPENASYTEYVECYFDKYNDPDIKIDIPKEFQKEKVRIEVAVNS